MKYLDMMTVESVAPVKNYVHDSCCAERDVYSLWEHHCNECGSFPNAVLQSKIESQEDIQLKSTVNNLKEWVNMVKAKRENNVRLAGAQSSRTPTFPNDGETSRSSKRHRVSLNEKQHEEEHGESARMMYISPDFTQIMAEYMQDVQSNTPATTHSRGDDITEDSIQLEALFDIGDSVCLWRSSSSQI